MAYDFYLGSVKLPVTPGKLTVSIGGANQTVKLINEGEINVLKKPELTNISFTALLPNVKYPFSSSSNANQILGVLEQLKTSLKPFQFIVSRVKPNGQVLYHTNIKVSLEDYKIVEDSKQGIDVTVDITLKQYRDWGTKIIRPKPKYLKNKKIAPPKQARPAPPPPPQYRTHTVVRGDCLWNIAKKYLGNGARYLEIYHLNQAEIDGRNRGRRVKQFTIYPGQVFKIP